MDYETARQWLNCPKDRKLSELGEAVELLRERYGGYKAIASQVALSAARLSDLRRVFLLPEGIRWQVDEGRILIGHAQQISRLQGDDQWLLAFSIVQEKMSVQESKRVVENVRKTGRALQSVLRDLSGIRFDKVEPLMLPLTFEARLTIIRAAWTKKVEWADFTLRAIEEATRVDIEQIARDLTGIVDQLHPVREKGEG